MTLPRQAQTQVLDRLPVGVCVFASQRDSRGTIEDFRFLHVNQVAADLIGKDAGELLGQRMLEVLPGNREFGLFDRYVRVVELGEEDRHEFKYRADGIDSWFSNYSTKVGDGFVVVFADITGQRADHMEVTRSARLVQAMYDQSPFAKALIEAKSGAIQFTNQAFRDLVATSQGQQGVIRGETELCSAGYELLSIVDRVRHTGVSFSADEQALTVSSGETRYFRLDARFLSGAQKKTSADGLAQIQVSAFDVTEFVASRLQAEQLAWRLAEEEEQYRATFAAAPVGIAHLSADGGFRSGNQHLLSMLGMSESDLRGSLLRSLCDHPQDQGPLLEDFLTASSSTRGVEVRLRRRDSKHTWASLTLSPLRGRDGRVKQYVLVAEDISKRVEARQRLMASMQHKDEFLAILGHELRNPLAALRSASALLADLSNPEPQVQRIVTTLDRQTKQIGRLLDDLLEVGRISRGKLSLDKKRIDLMELLREVVEDQANDLNPNTHELELHCAEHSWTVFGDELRLKQVLDNLLANAIKYTPQGGRIDVSVEPQGEDVLIVVKDTGVGIAPEFLKRLFVPFEQAPQDLARSRGGLGLGLALAAQIVRAHGGAIFAHSEGRGRGSIFSIQLPCEKNEVDEPSSSQEIYLKPTHFLLVEDNADAAELLQLLLESKGHRVLVCDRGDRALAEIERSRPEVVLCDIGLPQMSGYEIARAVRKNPNISSTLLIALSGYGRAQDREKAQRAGFDGQLNKPADYKDICLLAARLIAERAAPVSS